MSTKQFISSSDRTHYVTSCILEHSTHHNKTCFLYGVRWALFM